MSAVPSARVVAITKPLVSGVYTAGEFVAYAARVSNPGNQTSNETAPRLLDYLKRHRHWSPFEMSSAVVEIVTTRDIARQLLRHRSFSFQEFSQRYAEVDASWVMREARMQHPTNRQMSIGDAPSDTAEWWKAAQAMASDAALAVYSEALRIGIAKEVARAVLPEGMTISRLYAAGSFRSWLHYLDVREDPTTQLEHRDLARAIRAALAEQEPLIFGGEA